MSEETSQVTVDWIPQTLHSGEIIPSDEISVNFDGIATKWKLFMNNGCIHLDFLSRGEMNFRYTIFCTDLSDPWAKTSRTNIAMNNVWMDIPYSVSIGSISSSNTDDELHIQVEILNDACVQSANSSASTVVASPSVLEPTEAIPDQQQDDDIITIITDDGIELKARREVLVEKSSVFKEIIEDMNSPVHDKMIIKDFTSDVITQVLCFLHYGEVGDIQDIHVELFRASRVYDIPLLADICYDSMNKGLSHENLEKIVDTITIAHAYDLKSLFNRGCDKIKRFYVEVRGILSNLNTQLRMKIINTMTEPPSPTVIEEPATYFYDDVD